MKFPFLKKLFPKDIMHVTAPMNETNQPQQEIDNILNSEVGKVIIDDSLLSTEAKSSQILQRENDRRTLKTEHDRMIKETPSLSGDFLVLKEVEGNTLEVDKIRKISKITWNGSVNINAAKQLITMGADSVEFDGYKKLILDRSHLLEFDAESRVWIKGMLVTRAKKIVRLVDQMAIVKPKTTKGSIFSNFIGSAINIVMPNLEMKTFDNVEEAKEWLG